MTCFIFSRKIEVCCNRIRDVVREKYICSKLLARVLSGKRCIARQLSYSQGKVAQCYFQGLPWVSTNCVTLHQPRSQGLSS